jgi:sodium/potassium-transporting ATPase subunit alpha
MARLRTASEVVVGDLVKLSTGNKVPADIRLLDMSDDLRFSRSVLTGESEEIDGSVHMVSPPWAVSSRVTLVTDKCGE